MTRFLMTKSASRKLRVALVLLSVLLLICSLTACVNVETESRMRGHCETVLDALLAGDTEAAYAVLTAAGSDKAGDYGDCIFTIPEDEDRVRYYHFQLVDGSLYEGDYTNAIYEIVGPGSVMDNWHLKEEVDLHKNIYD